MQIEEMKRIADARTKGPWQWDELMKETITNDMGMAIIETESRCYPPSDADADFIMMAENNWDKLMAVVDAASKMDTGDFETCTMKADEIWLELQNALEKLEEK